MFVVRLSSIVATSLLVVAACSSGDSSEDAVEADPASGAIAVDGSDTDAGGPEDGSNADTGGTEDGSTADGSTADGPAVVAEPTSIEEFEVAWAAARADAVASIQGAGYGVGEDDVLRGPDGFELDLSLCPPGWTDGLDDGQPISIGYTAPRSGNLFAYGLISTGFEAYIDYVNQNGGVDGRQIEVLVRDDGYDSARTAELVEELVAVDDPFAVTTFGDLPSFAARDELNVGCIPQPFVDSPHPAWGDPENFPWTTGMYLPYSTEAILWGSWIEQNLADQLPVTVGALVVNNQFGSIQAQAFGTWANENPDVVAEFIPVSHDPGAAAVSGQMEQLAAQSPDVFIAMTTGDPCRLAVSGAASVGFEESEIALLASSVCKSVELYMGPAGTAGEGFRILDGGWKVTSDPDLAEDPFVAWANTTLTAAGADTATGFFGRGFAHYGWAMVEALRIAAELDGGLTRSNFLLAQRAVSLDHPALIDGIRFSTSGMADPYPVEGSQVLRYNSEEQAWIQDGPVLDINGQSPNCRWVTDNCGM